MSCNIFNFLFFVFMTCVAFGIRAEKMSPVDSSKYCFEKYRPDMSMNVGLANSIVYKPDGHVYATASVAIASGLDPSRAFTLAYFSQYPDIEKDYDAVAVGIRYSYTPWQWSWRNTVLAKLHSLHGGDNRGIERRRKDLADLISSLVSDHTLDWQTGLLIHSFGDSFAHTYSISDYGTDKENAYGPILGHAWDSKFGIDPDIVKDQNIPQYFKKFSDYITALFKSLKQSGASEEQLTKLLSYYNEMKCDDNCPTYFEITSMEESESNKERLTDYMSCMFKNTQKLTQKDIYRVTDKF